MKRTLTAVYDLGLNAAVSLMGLLWQASDWAYCKRTGTSRTVHPNLKRVL